MPEGKGKAPPCHRKSACRMTMQTHRRAIGGAFTGAVPKRSQVLPRGTTSQIAASAQGVFDRFDGFDGFDLRALRPSTFEFFDRREVSSFETSSTPSTLRVKRSQSLRGPLRQLR